MKVEVVVRLSSQALICKPQRCAWSMTGLFKPEASAGCKGPGQSSRNRGLGFWRAAPKPIVYRQLLGKCGHGEVWPGGAREGTNLLYSTCEDPRIVFSLVGLFSKVKRMRKTWNKLWCHHGTRLKTSTLWQQWSPFMWIVISCRGPSHR